MMYSLKKFFLQSPGHYVAAVIVAVLVGVFRHSTLPAVIEVSFRWYETLSVAGYVTFLVGALMTVSYFGAFDLFGYAFGERKKYRNYTDYTQKKTETRSRGGYFFVPYYVVGVAVILVSRLFA